MTTKEKVIKESIKKNTKRLDEINFLLKARPVSRICQLRRDAKKLFDENKGIEKRTSKDFIAKIDKLANEEKEMFELFKRQHGFLEKIDEKIKLEMELRDLNTELYFIELRRQSSKL